MAMRGTPGAELLLAVALVASAAAPACCCCACWLRGEARLRRVSWMSSAW